VEAQILTLDREERKMSLGIKQLKPDPWENIEEKYPVNSKHKATVRNFTNFGVFVELEEGVDGLIHISDLSWTKKINHPAEFVSIGDKIEVMVLEIDKENRRLSLGHKQLEENPWDVFEEVFTEGSVHEGTVIDVFDKGAMVALPYGVEGFVSPKHLVKEDGNTAKVDEKLPFKVIEFNKEGKKIVLSHRRVYEDEKRDKEKAQTKTTRKNMKKVNKNVEKTTLGDISDLASLKDEMQSQSRAEAKKKAEEREQAQKKAEEKKEAESKQETGEKEEETETKQEASDVKASEQNETKSEKTEESQQEQEQATSETTQTGEEEQEQPTSESTQAGEEEQQPKAEEQSAEEEKEEDKNVEAKKAEDEGEEKKDENKEEKSEGNEEKGNEEEKQ
jgi:predicted RNA-binding protein with RPS1 domain